MKTIHLPLYIFITILISSSCSKNEFKGREVIDISGQEWHLWLDTAASWKNDSLFLPPVNIKELPVNKPTKGWEEIYNKGKEINLPATIEEYSLDKNKKGKGIQGDYKGVAWFVTKIYIPEEMKDKLIRLLFESLKQRGEIFINRKLAGYDCIGNSAFDIDISNYINYGKENEIAIRVTDPGGNFSYNDGDIFFWGDYPIPMSSGFGGITGKVKLAITEKTFIDHVFIKNKPSIHDIEARISLIDSIPCQPKGNLVFTVLSGNKDEIAYTDTISIRFNKQVNRIDKLIQMPGARLWNSEIPYLYTLRVEWFGQENRYDKIEKTFGFRWFDFQEKEGEQMLLLNHQRMFMISANSQGLWPANGLYPNKKLAAKQLETLKQLGINTLNYRGSAGHSLLLDMADKRGFLYSIKPGDYISEYDDSIKKAVDNPKKLDFGRQLSRHQLFRMMQTHRNHPSLIFYTIKHNKAEDPEQKNLDDLKKAHQYDPTRYVFYSNRKPPSFSQTKNDYPCNCENKPSYTKLYMEPYQQVINHYGWCFDWCLGDQSVYRDTLYNGPENYYTFSGKKEEALIYEDFGATGTISDLESINNTLDNKKQLGWDGRYYLDLYTAYQKNLAEKGFKEVFPTIQTFTQQINDPAYYYQGRMIENARINNHIDGYTINHGESGKLNHRPGITDIYRNPKGNPEILSHYTQDIFVAAKARNKVVKTSDSVIVDFFLVNQKYFQGTASLIVETSTGNQGIKTDTFQVKISGDNTFGELLKPGYKTATPFSDSSHYINISARLIQEDKQIAQGREQIFAIDATPPQLSKEIAVSDSSGILDLFMNESQLDYTLYRDQSEAPKASTWITGQYQPDSISKTVTDWIKRGNTLILLSDADHWLKLLSDSLEINYQGKNMLKTTNYGGNYFIKKHPLFAGLPTNQVMGWEYQSLVNYDDQGYGLLIENNNPLIGAIRDEDPRIYNVAGMINMGKGRIIYSSLNILPSLLRDNKANIITKKMTWNLLRYAEDLY